MEEEYPFQVSIKVTNYAEYMAKTYWCVKNNIKASAYQIRYPNAPRNGISTWCFRYSEDAVAFKLRFGQWI